MSLRERVGPFRLVARLGEGGFAPVWLAAEEYGGVELRTVALKLFAEAEVPAGSARAQVVAEARALCRVEHPNIVRFYQLVEMPDVLALAMEHVQGTSIEARLQREGRLSVAETLAIGAGVASALAAVHAAGLVHRDVKPANVLDANGTVKLIDFGIASRLRHTTEAWHASTAPAAVDRRAAAVDRGTGTTLTSSAPPPSSARDTARIDVVTGGTSASAGTMGYVDPACIGQGRRADASSDLYGLGATLYECLTGLLPASDGGDPSRIRVNVALGMEPPPPITQRAPDLPEDVARLVMALVAPRREHRPRSAEVVHAEIERLRRVTGHARRELPIDGPFRALLPFDERHRDLYFGRSAELATAVAVLRARGGLALVGPSGCGKTSLARAGVIPELAGGALGSWPKAWKHVAFSPGSSPRTAFGHAMTAGAIDVPVDSAPAATVEALAAYVEGTSTGLVLYVDALEELVTLTKSDEIEWLASFVAEVVERSAPGLRVVLSLRSDLLDALLAVPRLGPVLPRIVQLVAPLSPEAWMDALEERLRLYGFRLENDELRTSLERELAGTSEAMPLVEFAFSALWQARDAARMVIPQAALQAMGGLSGALVRHADATIATIGDDADHVAERILVGLTTPHGTRARRTVAELDIEHPRRDEILGVLERARLVVSTDEGLTLAHDALAQRWPLLRSWIDALRRDRETAREVEAVAARWATKRDRALLLRGEPLREALALQAAGKVRLGHEGDALVAASRRARTRDHLGLASLVVLVIGGVGFVLFQFREDDRAAAIREREVVGITRELLRDSSRRDAGAATALEVATMKHHACMRELARYTDAGVP